MFRGLARSILAAATLVAINSVVLGAGSFEKLLAQNPVGSMAITEDGRHLLVSHGTISVFSPKKKWELVDQVEVGTHKVGYMSSPQGKYFNDHILVTTLVDRNDVRVHLVDTKNDRFREVHKAWYMSVSTVSYNGKYFFSQGVIGHSPSGSVSQAQEFPALVKQTKETPFGRHGGGDSAPILAQVREGNHWFGHNFVFRGMPPKMVSEMGDGVQMVVPDRNQGVCYAVSRTAVRAIALDARMTDLGSQDVAFPKEHERMKAKGPWISPHDCAANDYQNVAITRGGKLHVFLRSHRQKAIYYAHIDPFEVPEVVAAAIRGGVSSAGGNGPKAGGFPEKVALGKLLTYHLMGEKTPGRYQLVSGPKGVKISRTGVLTWKPTKQQVGLKRLKIRATVDGKTIDLDRRYTKIFERKEDFVAYCGAGIDLLNKKTGKTIKSIDVDYSPIGGVASHPFKKVTYVSVNGDSKTGGLIKSKPVLEVNESTGKIRKLSGVYGSHVSIHPTGKYLYTTTHEIYKKGVRIDWNIGRVLDDYGHIDLIIAYDISGRSPRHVGTNSEPGANGRRLIIAPDGTHVSYVAGGGAPGRGYSIAALRADDVDHESARYQIEAYPQDICYHPMVDLVACTNSKTIWIFDRKTKEKLSDRIDVKITRKDISKILFSPSGSRLLVVYKHPRRGLVLESVALKLTTREQAAITKGYRPPLPAEASKHDPRRDAPSVVQNEPIPLDKLEALRDAATKQLTTKEIARRYTSAVVVVSSDSGTGTGFVIGSSGYILTCEHVLPELGSPTITYRASAEEKSVDLQVKAAVVRVDEKHDLALLKIDPRVALPTVKLATIANVETGENVSVIGNPGLGGRTLNHTLTTGVVSSPQRILGGVEFIQTSAAINPGCSGGPIFNDRGGVIGMVSLKARIENTGFAVPTRTILAFLGAKSPFVPTKPVVRTWTDRTGKSRIEAQLVWLKYGQVRLKKKTGTMTTVPLEKLSANDREFLRKLRATSKKQEN